MAVIWKKHTRETRYEVRTAGNSTRLYTNGIFHSQYNNRNLFSGSVWDLLGLPGLFLKGQSNLRILVLGVGGGAVIHQLNHILNPISFVGIELDKTHINIAKRFFDLKQNHIKLICDNAQTWLDNFSDGKNSHHQFDLIIDDIFIEKDGEPIRAISADKPWFNNLLKALNSNGIIVQNHATSKSFRHCAYFKHADIAANFQSVFKLHNDHLDNVIGVFCKQNHDNKQIAQAVAELRDIPVIINRQKLDYFIRKISASAIT